MKKGFTLIELVICIVVILLMILAIAPSMSRINEISEKEDYSEMTLEQRCKEQGARSLQYLSVECYEYFDIEPIYPINNLEK